MTETKGKSSFNITLLPADKEEVKTRSDFPAVAKELGFTLVPSGTGFMVACPFHEDKTPSCSLDPVKKIFHCFGCDESGDIFDFVQKVRSCDFKSALDYLAGRFAYPSQTPIPKQVVERNVSVRDSETSLTDVVRYWVGVFAKHSQARDYMASRGITDQTLYTRFMIGYSDNSLTDKLGESRLEDLKALGIVKDTGGEYFNGCIVFPVTDELGEVVNIYGRKIKESKSNHLYSRGENKGIFNRKVSKVYDTVILVESILDTLSLVQMGVENVQALYGVNGFTAQHLEVLKADRVKTVVLALDNDAAGKAGTDKCKVRLLEAGLRVKAISPPEGKDWNDCLLKGVGRSDIEELIEKAPTVEPVKQDYEVEKKNDFHFFHINDITYRVKLDKSKLEKQKVALKVLHKDFAPKYDKVDLYSDRDRERVARTLSNSFDMESKRIDKDMITILEYFEREREEALNESSSNKPIKITEEEKRQALEFLTASDMFDRIVEHMRILGYEGEYYNKCLAYLCSVSRKLDNPFSIIVVSESATGKSMLGDIVKSLVPDEDLVSMQSVSDQALNYLPEENLMHKFLSMGEAIFSETVEHQIREMLSSKELSRIVVTKNGPTADLVTKVISKKVVVSTMMSSTNHNINPENLSRFFIIGSDESKEQTRLIQKRQYKKYSLERLVEKSHMVPQIIRTHKTAQRLLKKIEIVNPYGEYLVFPANQPRTRRDNERFVDLIATIGFLRQYQKTIKTWYNPETKAPMEYVECDLEDYRLAYDIMVKSVLEQTLSDIKPTDRAFYEEIRGYARRVADVESIETKEVQFTQKDVMEHTGQRKNWVSEHLRLLVDYEYIIIKRGGRRGERKYYSLPADCEIMALDLSMIPTPQQVEQSLTSIGHNRDK